VDAGLRTGVRDPKLSGSPTNPNPLTQRKVALARSAEASWRLLLIHHAASSKTVRVPAVYLGQAFLAFLTVLP